MPQAGTGPQSRIAPRRAALQGKALETVTQVLLVTLLPRLLGPVEFGRLSVALAIVTLGTVAISLGAPSAFARYLPAEPGSRRAGLARTMTARLVRVRTAQLAVAFVIGFVLVRAEPTRFVAADVALVLLALAVEVVAVLAAQVALGIGRTWVWSFRIATRNAALLIAVPLAWRAVGSPGVLEGLAFASAAGLIFAGWTVVGLLRRAERGVPVPAGTTRYGVVAGTALLFGQLTYRGPVLATSLLGGSRVETGFAALAGSMALAVMLAVREMFTVSLPEMVEQWEGDRARAERALRRLGWWSEAALVAAGLVGVLVLGPTLTLVVGAQFTDAAGALVPVLALLPFLPLPLLGWQGAALELRPELSLAMYAAGAIAFCGCAVALVPAWGATGAATALLVGAVASSLLAAWKLPGTVPLRLLAVSAFASAGVLLLARAVRVGP